MKNFLIALLFAAVFWQILSSPKQIKSWNIWALQSAEEFAAVVSDQEN